MKWSELSMTEKNEVIKMAVAQGIRDIPSIKNLYEESVNGSRRFEDGGNLFSGEENHSQQMITTGGAGYIPNAPDIKKVAKEATMDIRQRLYDNIIPYGYHNPIGRAFSALVLNKPSDSEEMPGSGNVDALDELWAEYLQIPQSRRHYDPALKKSKYKPTKAINKDASYFALPLDEEERQYIVNKALYKDNSGLNPELGRYKIDLGEDENGKYASYYDSWDINPFRGTTAVGGAVSRFLGLDKIEDVSMGIGKPVEVYDRIYFNDFGQAEPSIQVTLPEIVVTGKKKAEGGPIHIKPSKKGTFTAAASKHGMGVQEFASKVLSHPEDYSLTMRKKANFARNASKWKH